MNNLTRSSKPVAIWIGIGVAMLLIQVVLGGVTRLTGSGLSITEWNIVTGTLPPLDEKAWLNEFDKYRQTPQYKLLNISFTLEDFQFIFFWEWLHRFWARLIGVVFLLGFVYLLSKKYLRKEMIYPLLILFLLGAMQGAIGWIMVASGLTGDAVYVKPTRLALHFIFAVGLIAYSFWFLLELIVPDDQVVSSKSIPAFTWGIVWLLIFQLVFGALMAGHKAATAAPTWPDINGSLVPGTMTDDLPFMINFIENKITIHFIHRGLAYLLVLLTIVYTIRLFAIRTRSRVYESLKALPLVLVMIQAGLGIVAVVVSPRIVPNQWGTFEWLAQLHQVTGITLMLCMVTLLYVVRKRSLTAAATH